MSVEDSLAVQRIAASVPDAPTLLWIHGLGESSRSFASTVAALPELSHVLVDLPGYGDAPRPDVALGFGELTALLVRLIATLPPVFVVGHSMGGVLATYVAERSTVLGIVNIDGTLTRGDCGMSAEIAAYTEADWLAHGFAEMRARVIANAATKPAGVVNTGPKPSSPNALYLHSVELVSRSTDDALAPRFAALGCRKLFIAGIPDGICVASRARLQDLAVPWVGLSPSGHWPHLEQPALFLAQLTAFVHAQ